MTQNSIATLLKSTRQYFWSKNFDEVEVPYFNTSLPLEPNLYTYRVNDWYLPASPEFALKESLAKNQSNCFAIAHCFRNLESTSPHHTTEFLMLEWYLVNQNLYELKISVQDYVSQFLKCEFIDFVIPHTSFDNEPDFNQYFLNEIEPKLPKDKAVFVSGYPAFLSPLANCETNNFRDRKREGMTPEDRKNLFVNNISNRFELYINGIEIANGCEENRDAESIKLAFEKELAYRHKNNLPVHPISEDFIKNTSLLPPCSGVGLGLNRLFDLTKNVR